MDFAASLSSAPERWGRIQSQLGMMQQPRDIGQDSAVSARSWLTLGKFRAIGFSYAECVPHKFRANYSHRMQREWHPLQLYCLQPTQTRVCSGELHSTPWVPSFIFY